MFGFWLFRFIITFIVYLYEGDNLQGNGFSPIIWVPDIKLQLSA